MQIYLTFWIVYLLNLWISISGKLVAFLSSLSYCEATGPPYWGMKRSYNTHLFLQQFLRVPEIQGKPLVIKMVLASTFREFTACLWGLLPWEPQAKPDQAILLWISRRNLYSSPSASLFYPLSFSWYPYTRASLHGFDFSSQLYNPKQYFCRLFLEHSVHKAVNFVSIWK